MALGFILLTPLYNMAGWRVMFIVMGAIGLVGIAPLFIAALRPESEAPYAPAATSGPRHAKPLTFASLRGYPFLLLLFSYVMQGMLFWGVTLWIPLAVRSSR